MPTKKGCQEAQKEAYQWLENILQKTRPKFHAEGNKRRQIFYVFDELSRCKEDGDMLTAWEMLEIIYFLYDMLLGGFKEADPQQKSEKEHRIYHLIDDLRAIVKDDELMEEAFNLALGKN